jgi:hypothetical protein
MSSRYLRRNRAKAPQWGDGPNADRAAELQRTEREQARRATLAWLRERDDVPDWYDDEFREKA